MHRTGPTLTRRTVLASAAAAAALPQIGRRATANVDRQPRILVLLKLGGGNDGLNTVVPYADPAYAAARPTLAVPAHQVVPLDSHFGLHPGLAPLREAWVAGDLAIVLGAGDPVPNRSHFRATDIWETASDGSARRGWLAGTLAAMRRHDEPAGELDGLVLGNDPGLPFAGDDVAALTLPDPDRFLRQAAGMPPAPAEAANPALAHILQVQHAIALTAADLARAVAAMPTLATSFPDHRLGARLQLAARLIGGGLTARAYLVPQTGFDTHAGQAAPHHRLLSMLGAALAAFRAALIEVGAWHRVLVATYSEFGRRVAENASGGTDHGTAAPMLLLGGGIAGGFHGMQPSLTELIDGGDLVPAVDFRAVYAAIARDWLGVSASAADEMFGTQQRLRVIHG